MNDYVRTMLDGGELWPDAVLQLNPAYEAAETLGELADHGMIAEETARFFGRDIRLYRHQPEALEAAHAGDHYVVTTGTGRARASPTCPIVDHVLRNRPEEPRFRPIIVYPMNALINSQLAALQTFAKNWPGVPTHFRPLYGSGPGKDRDRILTDPPHILLTNYVMLEYMLIRPTDRALIYQATASAKIPRGRRVARLSRSPGRRRRHADAARPPARRSRRPPLHRHLSDARQRRKSLRQPHENR